jgi:hypothetical protein
MEKIPTHLADNTMPWPEDFKLECEPQPQFAQLESRFGLKCQCGGTDFTVKAIPVEGKDYCYQPLYAACTTCSAELTVFDRDQHGWSGSFIKTQYNGSAGEPAPYNCHSCGHGSFRLAVELSYPDDDDLAQTAEEAEVAIADLFTWITAYGKCTGCQKQTVLVSDECD